MEKPADNVEKMMRSALPEYLRGVRLRNFGGNNPRKAIERKWKMALAPQLIELFIKAVESGEIMDLLKIPSRMNPNPRGSIKINGIRDFLRNASWPNFPLHVINRGLFWNELAECKGWRLQKNMITHHCRILDPENVRRAWGGDDAMEQLFQRLNK